MPSRRFRLSVTAFIVLLAGTASGEDEAAYGAWTVRCEQADGDAAPECIMQQNLVLRTGGQPVLQFTLGLAPNDAQPTVLLKLPLGIYLPPGITLRIDAGPPATFPVERCDPDGCQAVMKMRPATLAALRAGQRFTITFHDAERRPLDMPLSLDGFGAAYDALQAGSSGGADQ